MTGLLVLISVLCGFQFQHVDQAPDSKENSSKRKFYEYPGDYGQEVQKLMDKFKADFGYELVEFGQAWRTDQMERLHSAFSELPPTFYRMPGVKGLYRLDAIMADSGQVPANEIPAAVLPAFKTIYEHETKSYKVFVGDQDPRAEFYNPLFYEDETHFKNIVHHEMAHLFDMTHGFLSFSKEWVVLTKYRVLNIPPLDGKTGSDFIYTLLNDADVDNYAPISIRHLPTYSRQNIQEDFANSVAAYIHYPYFRYSHPARYKFLKEKVFGGREYFPADEQNRSYHDKVLADLESAISKKDWPSVAGILVEVSRGYHPKLESEMVRYLREAIESGPAEQDRDHQLGLASCYLLDPGALKLRERLVRETRIPVENFLKKERCVRVSGNTFEKSLVKWPVMNAYFFRENDRDFLQFLDPIIGVAHARGYDTKYIWRVFAEDAGTRPIAQGNLVVMEGGNGSVKIDLATAEKGNLLPEGKILVLELGVTRSHPTKFKTFNSEISKIRFVAQPWFHHRERELPSIRVIYPFRAAYKRFN